MMNHLPFRVLFVQSHTEIGGAEAALLNMLDSLDRSRVEPVFVSLGFGHGDLPDRVQQRGIPVVRLRADRFRNLARAAQTVAQLRDVIKSQRIDVVVSNGGHPHLFARPAASWTRRPSVWWVHGYEPTDPLRGHWDALLQRFFGAEAFFANSAHTARLLRRDFPEGPPIAVVHPPVDLRRSYPSPEQGATARKSIGIDGEEFVVGMFGRLQPWKGQHIFLQAAALLKKRGVEARFLVVGGSVFGLDRAYAAQIQALAQHSGLNGQARFLGQRTDTNELMNACDVVVHASVEPEPWGLVVAEAMAAGRPVVASAAGGPVEMIEHGQTGLLVPPGDAHQLAAAVERLWQAPDLRHALGQSARRHAEEHFDAQRAAAIFCSELQQVRESFVSRP